MNAEIQSRVYRTWADHFELPYEHFLRAGTTVYLSKHPDVQAITLWSLGKRVLVETTPRHELALQRFIAGYPPEHRLSFEELRSIPLAGEHFQMPLYALEPEKYSPFAVSLSYTLRRLTPDDQPSFDAFLETCPQNEREDGDVSIEHMVAFGVFDGVRIVSASSVFIWRGFIDTGILTDPTYRGKGFGKALISACASYYLDSDKVVGYRHDATNLASAAIARDLGYTLYGMADTLFLETI